MAVVSDPTQHSRLPQWARPTNPEVNGQSFTLSAPHMVAELTSTFLPLPEMLLTVHTTEQGERPVFCKLFAMQTVLQEHVGPDLAMQRISEIACLFWRPLFKSSSIHKKSGRLGPVFVCMTNPIRNVI